MRSLWPRRAGGGPPGDVPHLRAHRNPRRRRSDRASTSSSATRHARLEAFGALVLRVWGTYQQAFELSTVAAAEFGWYDRNCAVNPYLVEGKKTCGLEIAEQTRRAPPNWVSVSVGDGCTVAGIWKG